LQLFELIAKAAGFDGSTRRVGFRKEEENDRFAMKVFETHRLA
jgi:hypothetical protein